jgi:hypothetical protein
MSLMLDSSATLAWIYANEITEPIRNVFDLVRENGAWAPGLWKLEGANILEMGVRRGRHDAAFRDSTLGDLALLPIWIDAETDRQAWGATLRLSERHRLTCTMQLTWNSRYAGDCRWPLSTRNCAAPHAPKMWSS